MSYLILAIIGIVVCVVGVLLTISVGKDVNASFKEQEENGDSVQKELESLKSKKHSFRNVRWILLIYVGTFLLAFLVLSFLI